jgi:hypothetical protein
MVDSLHQVFAWYFTGARDTTGGPLQGAYDFDSFANVIRQGVENCTIPDPPAWDAKTINVAKRELPAFGPYVLCGTRSNANLVHITSLVWDLDSMTGTEIAALVKLLNLISVRGFMYESPSSGLKGPEPRCRLALAVNRPVLAFELPQLKQHVANMLSINFDQGAEQLSQPAFVGRFAGTPARGWVEFQGEAINVDEELARIREISAFDARVASRAQPSQAAPFDPADTGEIVSKEALYKLGKRLERANPETKAPVLGRMLKQALDGARYAKEGERHRWNVRLAYVVGANFKHADADELAGHFAAALSLQAGKTLVEFADLIRSGQRKAALNDEVLDAAIAALTRPRREPPILKLNRQYQAPKLSLRA